MNSVYQVTTMATDQVNVLADTVVNLHHKVDSLTKLSDSLQKIATSSTLQQLQAADLTSGECFLIFTGIVAFVIMVKFFFDFMNE